MDIVKTTETVEALLPAFEECIDLTDTLGASIVIGERTIHEWSDYLVVKVPKDPNLQDLRSLFILVAKNMQIASYYFSIFANYNSTLLGRLDSAKAKLTTELVDDYYKRNAKRPAAQVLEQLSLSYLDDINSQIMISKLLKEFFREKRDMLIEVRKCLEQVSLSHHMEIKYHETL